MALTFLQLTNGLLRRLNEVELTSATFTASRGVQTLAKDAIKASIARINRDQHKWPFNWTETTQVLVPGQTQYPWPEGVKLPDWDSFQITGDESLNIKFSGLKFLDRDQWYRTHRDMDMQAGMSGREAPKYVFPMASGGFGVSPSPDKAYSVRYGYWRDHEVLSLATDTTRIPVAYEDIIVEGGNYFLLMFRDNRESAEMVYGDFKQSVGKMRSILINNQDYVSDTRVLR